MEWEKQKRVKNKAGSKREKGETTEDMDGGEDGKGINGEAWKASEAAASSGIQTIRDEIRAFRADFKNDMGAFRLSIRDDMRNELTELREEINQKFNDFSGELQTTNNRVREAEERIAELEEWNVAASDTLLEVLESQDALHTKLTDIEARSRRNNLRIYGGKQPTRVCDEAYKVGAWPVVHGNGDWNTALPQSTRTKASPRRTTQIAGSLLPRV